MTGSAIALGDFLAAEPAAILVAVSQALGSTPREAGAWMLVSPGRILGTIGGGQLEFMAIDEARRMLGGAYFDLPLGPPSASLRSAPPPHFVGMEDERQARGRPSSTPLSGGGDVERSEEGSIDGTVRLSDEAYPPHRGESKTLSIPLGPEIGQCCGGRVELQLSIVNADLRTDLLARAAEDERGLPSIYLFGAGHVGHALASALALLPLRVVVVETRADALERLPSGAEASLTAVPEALVRDAPAHSAFVILTHDHALDFLIAAEALRRRDAAYVGMIGSATKKATFRSWARRNAPEIDPARLVTPIGGSALRDKRPAVIAALAAAEIVAAVLSAPEDGEPRL